MSTFCRNISTLSLFLLPICAFANNTVKSTPDSDIVPIHIVSDRIDGSAQDSLVYSGNVIITQGARTFKTDKATYHKKTNDIEAEGNIYFSDVQLQGTSTYIKANTETNTAEMHDATYQYSCQNGRGDAYRIYKDGKRIFRLEDGTYTTCPVDDHSWRFSASEIVRDESTPYVDFYGPKFEILDVPVFYLPWIRLPATDERLTGLLYPNISYSSTNGATYTQPFYWNIDPQYDMTFTTKYMAARGVLFRDQIRYLTPNSSGSLTGEYMGDDDYYSDDDAKWGFNWTHSAIYDKHWKLNIDYSKVSSTSYFSHLSSSLGTRSDSQLLQTGTMAYRDKNWTANVTARDFQILSSSSYTYRMLPQVTFNYYAPYSTDALKFSLAGSVTRFDTDDPDKPDADRLYIAPAVNFPITHSWWNMDTEFKLHYGYYNQSNYKDSSDTYVADGLASHPSYTIPSVRWQAGLIMDRDTTLFGTNYRQSFEPKIQYLYIPEVDQSDIFNPVDYNSSNDGATVTGGYDTTLLQTDYIGLFRDTKYSGSDYIASANQLSIGATSRFYDDNNQEKFNISLGNIMYFENTTDSDGDEIAHSAWAGESDFNISDKLFFHTGMQFNSYTNKFQIASAAFEYHDPQNKNTYVQLNYHYISEDYLDLIAEDYSSSLTDDGISQAGILTSFNLGHNLSLEGGYFVDTRDGLLYEKYLKTTYKLDCWAIAFSVNQYLESRDSSDDPAEYDTVFSFAFYLLGFGNGNGPSIGDLDDDHSLDYRNAFYLEDNMATTTTNE